MKYQFEYTDTYGGESNYSWVKRGEVTANDLLHAFRLARKELGLTGVKGILERWNNDEGKWTPKRSCTVLFVNFKDQ
jgi:hypothetical protein